jgi:ariadne-1
MEEMQITSALTWIEVQFMKKAVEEVDKCRTTLKWTYAMAYYLGKGNEKDLFEDNQRFVSFSFSFYFFSFILLIKFA